VVAGSGDVSDLVVRLLGPLEVARGGRTIDLSPGRLRTIVAALAVSAGWPVSFERLALALWGDRLPHNTRRSIQTYISRLRAELGEDAILTSPSGYMLAVRPENVDALRFTQLVDRAAGQPTPTAELDALEAALALWRGTPLEGFNSWLELSRHGLVERYLAAVERRIDLALACGRSSRLLPELTELTAMHPLRESLWLRRLLVLQRSGRPAEALARYDTIRVRLADELGMDPGPDLQRAYTDLLVHRTPDLVIPGLSTTEIEDFAGGVGALGLLASLLGRGDGRPVVVRVLGPTVRAGKELEFESFVRDTAVPFMSGQVGLLAQRIGRAAHRCANEYLYVTVWDGVEAIRKFAGESWQDPMIGPDEEHLLKDAWVRHFEVAPVST
jgi:DNA-binding SARP family transcriptional activator